MSKTACKCKKAAECEECPEWIFTFADLVMLMMGFFVILWVLKPPAGNPGSNSAAQEEAQRKWEATVGEIRKGFGYEPDPHSNDPVDQMMIQRSRGTKNGAENEQPREAPQGTDHDSTSIRPGAQAEMGAALLFDRGQAKLTPQTMKLLDELADRIRGHNTIFALRGHASVDDLDNPTTGQEMDLSLRRALAVEQYLLSKGVAEDVLRVVGCSTKEPVHQRVYTSSGLAQNRRVEVSSTAQLKEERQDQNNTPAKPLDEKKAVAEKHTTKASVEKTTEEK